MNNTVYVIILMGAAGAGKSTVGRRLANELGWRFVDGDDFHPPGNLDKINFNLPFTDEDRQPWLERLRTVVTEWVTAGSRVKCIDESLPHLSNRGAEAGKQAPAMSRAVAICLGIRWVAGSIATNRYRWEWPKRGNAKVSMFGNPGGHARKRPAEWLECDCSWQADGTATVTSSRYNAERRSCGNTAWHKASHTMLRSAASHSAVS